jgi:ribosomal protein L40E
MSADRCPSCAAALPPDASWCGQCYADLRPASAPQAAPASVVEAPAPPEPVDPLTAPLPALPATLVAEAPAASPATDVPAQTLPGVVPAPTEQPTSWPCGRCQTLVPFDEDECPQCHARFLESPLPGADRSLLDKLPRGQRKTTNAALVIVVGGLVLMGLFIGLFALLGSIFG